MTEWALKRFWADAGVDPVAGGFTVKLDGRTVRTPAKTELVVPTKAMAEAMAAEWRAQTDRVDPLTMPVTRSANAALDKVRHQREEVADLIAAYGETDLLCYRAEGPARLIARQSEAWDPLLDWAAAVFGTRLSVGTGVMHVPQPREATEPMRQRVQLFDPFELAAFHDLVSLSGSLVIGLAVIEGHRSAKALWPVSRVDEIWQEEQWGQDEEATAAAEIKRAAFLHAERFFQLSRK